MDDATSMRDFAAFCSGIPTRFNSDHAEDELVACLANATGEKVLGASICWSYKEQCKRVHEICDRDISQKDMRRGTFVGSGVRDEGVEETQLTKMFKNVDKLLGFESPSEANATGAEIRAPSPSTRVAAPKERPARDRSPGPFRKPQATAGVSEDSIEISESWCDKQDEATVLRTIETAGHAIIVFETERSRDLAVEKVQNAAGVAFGEKSLQLTKVECEPDTMLWDNCAWPTGWRNILSRLLWGILGITVALIVWAVGFYLPYAVYTLSFSYARGEVPGFAASFLFTMLVVAGNQIMYFLCSYVTNGMRFWCQDTFEFTYMVLYTFACFVNLIFDLMITFWTTNEEMIGMGIRTWDGKDLRDLGMFDLWASYPMQRALGNQLFWYAFPSCFLLPFILEPIFAIYLPLHIAKLIVRSNTDFRGYSAEQALEFFCPMDLSRYADIMLNVAVAVLILMFPGGYMLQTFGCLCASHIYMYAYDHYRVLRAIPGCDYGSDNVDQSVNMLMALPCCILLACLIFKMHCLPGNEGAANFTVVVQIIAACTVHTVLHISMLLFVVPCCGRVHHRSESSYAEAASRLPCNWFNANPVHCLRSKYIYHHKPAFTPYVRGKEHLQTANPSIGAYYQGSSIKYWLSDETSH